MLDILNIQEKLHKVGVPAEVHMSNVLFVSSREMFFDNDTIAFEIWLDKDSGLLEVKTRGKVKEFMSLADFWYKQTMKVVKKHNNSIV